MASTVSSSSSELLLNSGVVYSPSVGARPFVRGLEYVAISRCPNVNMLFLLNHLRESLFTSYWEQIVEMINHCMMMFSSVTSVIKQKIECKVN